MAIAGPMRFDVYWPSETDLKGSSLEMKFVYQKGYPTSFFHDDGPAGVTVFTRQ